jgi:hypothetical protein
MANQWTPEDELKQVIRNRIAARIQSNLRIGLDVDPDEIAEEIFMSEIGRTRASYGFTEGRLEKFKRDARQMVNNLMSGYDIFQDVGEKGFISPFELKKRQKADRSRQRVIETEDELLRRHYEQAPIIDEMASYAPENVMKYRGQEFMSPYTSKYWKGDEEKKDEPDSASGMRCGGMVKKPIGRKFISKRII